MDSRTREELKNFGDAVRKELMVQAEGAIHEFRQSLKQMDDEQVAALIKSKFSGVRNDARRELSSRGIGTC